jgi:alpha-L-arabinofuranosidase
MEAAWSYDRDDWRTDFIDITKDLAPAMMRFGGVAEPVLQVARRAWGRRASALGIAITFGAARRHIASGTREFVDFCRRVNSEPLYCVNFLADGFEHFAHKGGGQSHGDAAESRGLGFVLQRSRGQVAHRRTAIRSRLVVKFWQLGNETNYGRGGFNKETGDRSERSSLRKRCERT